MGPQQVGNKTMSKKWIPQKVEKQQCLQSEFIYVYIPSYTLIYFNILSNSFKWLYIPSYTPIYIKISNIRKMGSDIRPKNGHKWSPWGSPWARIWHVPYYHTGKHFFTPKGPQFKLN